MVGEPPHSLKYQPYFCEENVWHVCASLGRGWAVFVSNPTRAVFFLNQRARPVGLMWDYHVVHLDDDGTLTDLDHALELTQPVSTWIATSFAGPKNFAPMFRPVEANVFVATFASDRSHMLVQGEFQQEPPPWPPIGEGNTLGEFLAIDDNWLTLAQFREWIDSWRA